MKFLVRIQQQLLRRKLDDSDMLILQILCLLPLSELSAEKDIACNSSEVCSGCKVLALKNGCGEAGEIGD
jgi:hypothetical protein